MLGLEPYLKRKPDALSGGQRQRVAMGRAIVREPQAFLTVEDGTLAAPGARYRVLYLGGSSHRMTLRALAGCPEGATTPPGNGG